MSNGDGFKEVWLLAQAVTGLVKLNKKKTSEQHDMVFTKALLIGLCTIKKIKESERIEDGILELIEGRNQ